MKNLSLDYLLTANCSHVYYSAHAGITVDKNRNGLAFLSSKGTLLHGSKTPTMRDLGVTMGPDIKLPAEAGRLGFSALLESPSWTLWAFCEVERCCGPREMSWLRGQSGLVHATTVQWQYGRCLVPLTLAQESSPGRSLFEDCPLVAVAGGTGT